MKIAVILFDDFELLDVFGPVELLQFVPGYELEFYASSTGSVRSSHGLEVVAPLAFTDFSGADLLLVPGGQGTRNLVKNSNFIEWLTSAVRRSAVVASVCTGAALLAQAGALEGYRATSNKRAFDWVMSFGSNIDWQASARWAQDRNRWTSSGIAAGMDMTAALIRHFEGAPLAREIVDRAELRISEDPNDDPFAR